MATAIAAIGLGRTFGPRRAVADLSFSVEEGEVFGLLGPNGAGKTTTVRMLCGLLPPSEGEALVCGLRVGQDDELLRSKVGLLTEQPGLYDRLSALENLLYFARLYRVPEPAARERIARWLAAFGLEGRADEKVGGFSKGMRQKVAIARSLVHEPKIVFLDEPTSGLDPEASSVVRGIVQQLASEGRTIVLCTHNLDEAARLCTRVAVVKGRIVAMGPVSGLSGGTRRIVVELLGEAGPLLAEVSGLPGILACSADRSRLFAEVAGDGEVAELVARLVGRGARIRSVTPDDSDLERAYLRLVREG